MEIYCWNEKGKDWFAIQGENDDFFMDAVDNGWSIFDQEENVNWIVFWTDARQSSQIKKVYSKTLMHDKPITDIAQTKLEDTRSFEAMGHELETKMTKDWINIKPLDRDLSDVTKIAEKELQSYLGKKA